MLIRIARVAKLFSVLLVAALLLGATSCEKVDGTGRGTFLLTSADEENQMGANAYKEILAKEKRSTDAAAIALVERVGKRLAAAAPDRGFKYEFTVLESNQINAFCLPGGKVAVYTAILPYCKNEAGLAAVLGHEIAHAIARHGGERMSQGVVQQGVATGLDLFLKESGVTNTTHNFAMAAYGAGSTVGVMLPFSRKHELEADYLGLLYMSKAGYDPKEAPQFWGRFSTISNGGMLPEKLTSYLSTHPASPDRARLLEEKLPEAQKLYDAAPAKYGAGELVPEAYRKDIPVAAQSSDAKKEPAKNTATDQPAQPKKKKKK